MRVRDHVALATVGAALLQPLLGSRVIGAWAGAVLIDVDHYLWFAVRQRDLSPIEAVRYFNRPEPPHDPAVRLLHSPLPIMLAVVASSRRRELLPIAIGMAAHVALDVYHEARVDRARATALQRDGFTCRECGGRVPQLVAHLERQPFVLPSYRDSNFIALCADCHEAAHAARAHPRGKRREARV